MTFQIRYQNSRQNIFNKLDSSCPRLGKYEWNRGETYVIMIFKLGNYLKEYWRHNECIEIDQWEKGD